MKKILQHRNDIYGLEGATEKSVPVLFDKKTQRIVNSKGIKRKKIKTRTTPAMAPSSGRFMSDEKNDSFLRRSSAVG